MNTIKLDTSQFRTTGEAYALLKENQLHEGDRIFIYSSDRSSLNADVILMLILIKAYFVIEIEKNVQLGKKLMEELFGEKSSKELEEEVEAEYGIQIEVEPSDSFREDWGKLATQGFLRAYGEDEPDYSKVKVKEANPDYKPPEE